MMRLTNLFRQMIKTRWIILLLILLTLTTFLTQVGCQRETEHQYSGYAEAELVYMASGLSGYLKDLKVKRGDWVNRDSVLFNLEDKDEIYSKESATAKLQGLEDTLNDIKKGKRPDEIAALIAQKDQALAALHFANLELDRNKRLLASKAAAQEEYDKSLTDKEQKQARVEEIEYNIHLAKQGDREDQIKAAKNNVAAARAALATANWQLEQKSVKTTMAARVEDTLYQPGEWVPAGMPVVVLLPKENIKIRFFVSEADLNFMALNKTIEVAMDGVNTRIPAKISFIAQEAEFTPPMIFSVTSRNKLVFLVEAEPSTDNAFKFHPGQPVTIFLKSNDH